MQEPDFYMAYSKGQYSVFRHQEGQLLTHEQWENLKNQVNKFYETLTPEFIELHNEKVFKERNPEKEFHYVPPVVIIPESLQSLSTKPNWIYWVRSNKEQGVKIGRTERRLSVRLRQLAKQFKSEIYCLGAFHTQHCNEIELLAHDFFEEKRIKGEWFNLDQSEIDSIPTVIKTLHLQRGLEWAIQK